MSRKKNAASKTIARDFDLRFFGRGGLTGFVLGEFRTAAAGAPSVFAWPVAYALSKQHHATFTRPVWDDGGAK